MNKKAFTLTEILIVMVVAGILLAMILPNTLKAIERAEVTEHRNNLQTGKTAIFMCFTESRDWDDCDSITELESGLFLEPNMEHPFGGTYKIQDHPTLTGKIFCGD